MKHASIVHRTPPINCISNHDLRRDQLLRMRYSPGLVHVNLNIRGMIDR